MNTRLALTGLVLLLAPPAAAYAPFTPAQVIRPIYKVTLLNSANSETTVYQCTSGPCTVDLADPTALANLLSTPVTFQHANVFRRARVYSCASGNTSYTISVTGRVPVDDDQYATCGDSSCSAPLQPSPWDTPATPTPVSITATDCMTEVPLNGDLTVNPSDMARIWLSHSPFYLAGANLSGPDPVSPGCTGQPGGTQVCVGPARIQVSHGTNAPTLETYLLMQDMGGGLVQLWVDPANDVPFSGHSIGPSWPFGQTFSAVTPTPGVSDAYDLWTSPYTSFAGNFKRKRHTGSISSGSYDAARLHALEMPDCPSSYAMWNHSLINPNDVDFILPLGNISPGGNHIQPTGHIYFALKQSNGYTVSSYLVAPADIVVGEVTRQNRRLHSDYNVTDSDYRLTFSSCRQTQGYLNHLTALSSELEQAYDQAKQAAENAGDNPCEDWEVRGDWEVQNCIVDLGVRVDASELIAYVGNQPVEEGLTFDLGFMDSRREITTLLRPSHLGRFPGDHDDLHKVCGLDYFASGFFSGNTFAGVPIGGTSPWNDVYVSGCGGQSRIGQDVAGTARGRWQTPYTTSESQSISLTYANFIDGFGGQLSMAFGQGTGMTGLSGTGFKIPAANSCGSVNQPFELVQPGLTYCYQGLTEFGTGNTPQLAIFLKVDSTDGKLYVTHSTDSLGCGMANWPTPSEPFER